MRVPQYESPITVEFVFCGALLLQLSAFGESPAIGEESAAVGERRNRRIEESVAADATRRYYGRYS